MDINEHLAVKVMEMIPVYFEKHRDDPEGWGYVGGGHSKLYKADWNPRENIEQAIMCAEKVGDGWALVAYSNPSNDYRAMSAMQNTGDYCGTADAATPAEALSLAVAYATGWEE